MPPPRDSAGRRGGGGGGPGSPDSGMETGTAGTALAAFQPNPRVLAVDGTYVYFTCGNSGGPSTGRVRRVPKAGGNVDEIASALDAPYAIVLAQSDAIVSLHEPSAASGSLVKFATMPNATQTTIVSAIPTPAWLITDGVSVFYSTSANGAGVAVERTSLSSATTMDIAQTLGAFFPGGLAIAGAYVYFTTGSAVYRALLAGGGAESLDQEPGALFSDLVVVGGRVWIADSTAKTGRIVSIATSGGQPRVDASNLDSPARVATDGTWLYYTSAPSGSIGAVSTIDASIRVVTTGLSSPFAIVVDDAIYVTTADSIIKIPKL